MRDLLAQRGRHELIAAQSGDKVGNVIALLKSHGISQIPVMDDGHLLGLVAEVDLLNFMLSGAGYSNSEIAPIVHNHVPYVTETTPLDDVSAIFTRSPHEAVLVQDGNTPTDIITKIDLIDYLLKTPSNQN